MIVLKLLSIAKNGAQRGIEGSLSRHGLRLGAWLRLPLLWCVSLDLCRLGDPASMTEEKEGLHISKPDHDGWNTVYYRRPGSMFYGVLVIGRRESWFEQQIDRHEQEKRSS